VLPLFLADALEACSELGIVLLGDMHRFQEICIGALFLFQIQE
jgi:hypothetical protein